MKKSRHLLMPIDLEIMLLLLKRKAHKEAVSITSEEIGEVTGYAQQTANRNLKELEDDGIVERSKGRWRSLVKLTDNGAKMLRDLANEIEEGFA